MKIKKLKISLKVKLKLGNYFEFLPQKNSNNSEKY